MLEQLSWLFAPDCLKFAASYSRYHSPHYLIFLAFYPEVVTMNDFIVVFFPQYLFYFPGLFAGYTVDFLSTVIYYSPGNFLSVRIVYTNYGSPLKVSAYRDNS